MMVKDTGDAQKYIRLSTPNTAPNHGSVKRSKFRCMLTADDLHYLYERISHY